MIVVVLLAVIMSNYVYFVVLVYATFILIPGKK